MVQGSMKGKSLELLVAETTENGGGGGRLLHLINRRAARGG